MRQNIQNGLTNHVIDDLLPLEDQRQEEHMLQFTPADGDPFFALLQTPNCVGTAFMM